jgi:hypothetical protein
MKKKHVTMSHVTIFLQAWKIVWSWLLRKVKTCCNTPSSKVLQTYLRFTVPISPSVSYISQQNVIRYSPQSSAKVRNQRSQISKPLSALTLCTQTSVPFFLINTSNTMRAIKTNVQLVSYCGQNIYCFILWTSKSIYEHQLVRRKKSVTKTV